MNYYTREIMQICKCDAETAKKVQDQMAIEGLDFSECSKRRFNSFAKRCYETVVGQAS